MSSTTLDCYVESSVCRCVPCATQPRTGSSRSHGVFPDSSRSHGVFITYGVSYRGFAPYSFGAGFESAPHLQLQICLTFLYEKQLKNMRVSRYDTNLLYPARGRYYRLIPGIRGYEP